MKKDELFHIFSPAPRQFVQTTFRKIAKNPTSRTRTIGTKMKPDISYKIKLKICKIGLKQQNY